MRVVLHYDLLRFSPSVLTICLEIFSSSIIFKLVLFGLLVVICSLLFSVVIDWCFIHSVAVVIWGCLLGCLLPLLGLVALAWLVGWALASYTCGCCFL